MAGADDDGGGGVDVLGHVLGLRHPLDLGDDVAGSMLVLVAVAARLGGGGRDEDGGGEGGGLHDV